MHLWDLPGETLALIGALIIGALYGALRALIVRYTRQRDRDAQELARWQGELERKAAEIRRLQDKMNRL